MKISVAIICFNEEKKIERCLQSVSWADEIVILDSHSTDQTVAICKKFTDKVLVHDFDGHIQQKNRVLEHCENDWVFSIDADEVVTDKLKTEIQALKKELELTDISGFFVNRKIKYLGKWIKHSNWYPDYKLRLFRKSKAKWGGVNPHDQIILDGKDSRLSSELEHYSYDSVSDHLRTVDNFTSIISKEYYKKGKRASIINLTLRPIYGFTKSYFIKRGFLEGKRGLIIAIIDSYYVFLKFVKLYEIQLESKKEK